MIIFDLNDDLIQEELSEKELPKDEEITDEEKKKILFERESLQVVNINGEIISI